jgi:peptidoglycan hydrolase-like protein with peptidoglycan-binding domain
MELKRDFSFRPVPNITTPLEFVLPATDSNLGPLRQLPGTWTGNGFNMIWRPNSTPGQDRFLELNLTTETLEFQEISGPIPNRGLLQPDIEMFGVTYLQQIKDTNNNAGLHIEPGIWATVPQTVNPAEVPTVVRMASIPHGTTLLAQGTAISVAGPPIIDPVDITPFVIGNAAKKIPFPESNLATPTQFRSPPADIVNITQAMVDNPNSVLSSAIAGQNITQTIVLLISSDPATPVVGGGLANTAFLQGAPAAGPNAQTALVTAIFWIETVTDPVSGSNILQLQYTQTVLLNFNGLSWPHITVGTLQRARNSAQPTIAEGDSGDAVRRLQRALRRTGDFSIVVDGVFGAQTTAAVKLFQQGSGLTVDGIVGPLTWAALPDGGPMPTLHLGSAGDVVTSLQTVLTNGAPGQWGTAPGAIDGNFGPDTQASVKAFQTWGGVTADGVVGDATWSVSLHAAGATLESQVGLKFVTS